MSDALRFLEPGGDRRAERDGLGALWTAVLERLPLSDRVALGRIRVGAHDTSDDAVPFAYTNDGDERVNLTLELKRDQLEQYGRVEAGAVRGA